MGKHQSLCVFLYLNCQACCLPCAGFLLMSLPVEHSNPGGLTALLIAPGTSPSARRMLIPIAPTVACGNDAQTSTTMLSRTLASMILHT